MPNPPTLCLPPPVNPGATGLMLVAVGASAGGLEPLKRFVQALTPGHATYVVAQHSASVKTSSLAHILGQLTPLPVVSVDAPVTPRPNTVYVALPSHDTVLADGHLCRRARSLGPTPNIDRLFFTVADELKDRSVAVVLSGTGTDGAMGTRAIRAAGGFTFAQTPESAQYSDMPWNAIQTGAVDWVLAPAAIAARTVALANGAESGADTAAHVSETTVALILQQIQERTGMNFHGYRAETVNRRLQRRMTAREAQTLADYGRLIEADPQELEALAKDILISVTAFHRDPAAFNALGHTLAHYLSTEKAPGGEVRVWVPGCATGEEAYTLAFMVSSLLERTQAALKVFATDIDAEALAVAQRGHYSAASVARLGEAWRGRYLHPDGDGYRVNQPLRDQVIFSRHDAIRDPPFANLDLVSCRNLLIYLNKDFQRTLLQKFHYALREQGLLFLGPSESSHAESSLFSPVQLDAGVHRRRPGRAQLSRSVSALNKSSARGAAGTPASPAGSPSSAGQRSRDWLVERFAPPCLVLGPDRQLLHASGAVAEFTRLMSGDLNLALDTLLEPTLAREANSLLVQAQHRETLARGVPKDWPREGEAGRLTLSAQRLSEADAPECLLLMFNWSPLAAASDAPALAVSADPEARLRDLERELADTQSQLNNITEEHQRSMEELNSLNEELQNANEEFQSTNEELEASLEELQSSNEELMTLNAELESKTSELGQLNDNLEAIQNHVLFALIVVDSQGTLQYFNRRAADSLGLSNKALGMPFGELALAPPVRDLAAFVERFFNHPSPFEEAFDDGERFFQLAVAPYVRQGDTRPGLVMTLWDNTEVYRANRKAEERHRQLMAIMSHTTALVSQKDPAGRYRYVNRAFTRLTGLSQEACEGRTDAQLFGAALAGRWRRAELEALNGHTRQTEEHVTLGARAFWLLCVRFPLWSDDGAVDSVVTMATDITELKTAKEKEQTAFRSLRHAHQALQELNDRLEGIIEGTPDAVAAIDQQQTFTAVNEAYRKAFERIYDSPVKAGMSLDDALGHWPKDLKRARHYWRQALEGANFGVESEFGANPSHERIYQISYSPIRCRTGRIIGACAIMRDVTERRRNEALLSYNEHTYRSLIEKTDTGYVTFDSRGRVLDANAEYIRLSGHARLESIRGRHASQWLAREEKQRYRGAFERLLDRGSLKNEQFNFADRHGRHTPVEINATALKTDQGVRVTAWCRDITERVEQQRHIERLAFYDSLTRIANRELLKEQLGNAITRAERHATQLAVLFVDLDGFKHINDCMGHEWGDRVLESVASRLKGCVRAEDLVARHGGDEFITVLTDQAQSHSVIAVARKILERLREPHPVADQRLNISASIGVSLYPKDGRDAATLIKHADSAMYSAKDSGRDGYAFFSPEMNTRSQRLVTLASQLSKAVEADELTVMYQPQQDLASGRIVGAEALLRWHRPGVGWIAPEHFIPVAEDTGLITCLGEWVIARVVEQLGRFEQQRVPSVPVSVNVSPRQCRESRVQDVIARALSDSGLPPALLALEFTENLLLNGTAETLTMLRTLKSMQVGLALDDFGSGYSSLSYLTRFPVDRLKIDKSFIQGIGQSTDQEAIVRAVIRLGQSLGLRVLAEGVETEHQNAFLKTEGCHEIQGFLLGPAVSAEALAARLSPDASHEPSTPDGIKA